MPLALLAGWALVAAAGLVCLAAVDRPALAPVVATGALIFLVVAAVAACFPGALP